MSWKNNVKKSFYPDVCAVLMRETTDHFLISQKIKTQHKNNFFVEKSDPKRGPKRDPKSGPKRDPKQDHPRNRSRFDAVVSNWLRIIIIQFRIIRSPKNQKWDNSKSWIIPFFTNNYLVLSFVSRFINEKT